MKRNLLVGMAVLGTFSAGAAEEQLLFIASAGKPSAIHRCTLDMKTGAFGKLEAADPDVPAGFLSLHPTLTILYAATTEDTNPTGGVRAYAIDRKTGDLTLLDKGATNDTGNTHLEVSPNGRAVVLCHYGGSGTSALALAADGSIEPSVSQIRHEGSSVDPKRQREPHPHGVAIHPSGRFVGVADLGTDRVEVYRLSEDAQLSKSAFWKSAAGAGPRHVAFHPSGNWLYCINELDSTLVALDFDAEQGQLTAVQTLSTLPDGFDGQNTTAEVVVHPNGKFLYGSNRGHESTAVFTIDPQTGKLTFVEREPTQGQHPRFVGLDPSGRIYIAANMNTGNLVSFWIDPKTGALEPTGHKLEVDRPMCVAFVE